ncbi:ABC transporter ATP-binding protein, partial [Cellulomonas sp.]|uniref:ABC transporter ATP-binding protein n=1 Tax=Cellulomonas sp. TaxID=40001 RepID=UPI002D58812E
MQGPDDDVVLSLDGVTHVFETGAAPVRAVDDVTAAFRRGTWTAIMGPSGSGKSTLLYCAAGLIRATAGRILLDGVDVRAASERRLTALRRQRLGFVFQDFNLVPALTAEQNVGLPARFDGRPAADDA